MKETIQQIENIQKYCSMIAQNGMRYKTDVFIKGTDLIDLAALSQHYDKQIICDEVSNLLVIEDENCKIYINIKN